MAYIYTLEPVDNKTKHDILCFSDSANVLMEQLTDIHYNTISAKDLDKFYNLVSEIDVMGAEVDSYGLDKPLVSSGNNIMVSLEILRDDMEKVISEYKERK